MPNSLTPGRKAPDLEIPLAGGGRWRLSEQTPEAFTLIEFYRGRHCPRCQRHLIGLNAVMPRLAERGVTAIAVSMDDKTRAEYAKGAWGLGALDLGYGLSMEDAAQWGLYISTPITEREPHPFNEPATFWIKPNGILYAAAYGTSPFARAHWPDWLEALDAIAARDYPPRGDYAPA